MESDYVIPVLKFSSAFSHNFLLGHAGKAIPIWLWLSFSHHLIPFLTLSHTILPSFLFSVPEATRSFPSYRHSHILLPYLECISPVFHVEGSFLSLVPAHLSALQRGLLWLCSVGCYSHSILLTLYHITLNFLKKHVYLVYDLFIYLFIVYLSHWTVRPMENNFSITASLVSSLGLGTL